MFLFFLLFLIRIIYSYVYCVKGKPDFHVNINYTLELNVWRQSSLWIHYHLDYQEADAFKIFWSFSGTIINSPDTRDYFIPIEETHTSDIFVTVYARYCYKKYNIM